MLYAILCDNKNSAYCIIICLFSFSLTIFFMFYSHFLFLFQAVHSLVFNYDDSVILLEQLYQYWNNVVSHLRLADRVKAFKYHMKEVNFDSLFLYTSTLLFLNLFVSSSSPKALMRPFLKINRTLQTSS